MFWFRRKDKKKADKTEEIADNIEEIKTAEESAEEAAEAGNGKATEAPIEEAACEAPAEPLADKTEDEEEALAEESTTRHTAWEAIWKKTKHATNGEANKAASKEATNEESTSEVADKATNEEVTSEEADQATNEEATSEEADKATNEEATSEEADKVTNEEVANEEATEARSEEAAESLTEEPADEEAASAEESTPEPIAEQEAASNKKKGFFARLKEGLTKTRDNIVKGIDSVFSGFSSIDDEFYEELEEILVMGDIGINATTAIVERLKKDVKEKHIKNPSDCKQLLIDGIKEQMRVDETAYEFEEQQSVIMVIGVNGVGKTTTVGKLAGKLKEDGKKVLIAAADTFRAAAGDQLAEWARRADVPMIGGKEGADPASVVFDAVHAAKARGVDVLLIDTAGRLHNKKNLMEELRKMNRIIDKEYPHAHRENLIVLDGTTGQNALVQAREFGDVTDLTGIVLTKMDGTAKGGIAIAIQSELKVPVKYIGIGETIDDLQKFDSDEFVNALFDVKQEE